MRTDRLEGRCGSQDASGAGARVPGLITTNPGSVVDDHQRRRARTWYLGIGPGDTQGRRVSLTPVNDRQSRSLAGTRMPGSAALTASGLTTVSTITCGRCSASSAGTPMARRRIRNRRSASFAAPTVTSTARNMPQTSTSRRSRHSDQTGGRDCQPRSEGGVWRLFTLNCQRAPTVTMEETVSWRAGMDQPRLASCAARSTRSR
jgi:hypothetical protein